MNAPEWLVPGAEVATYCGSRGGRTLKFATVERVGKRDVVLSDGQRFNVNTLTRREGGSWGWTVMLFQASGPVVVDRAEEVRREKLESHAKDMCGKFLYSRGEVSAYHVIVALAPLTGIYDELRVVLEGTTTANSTAQ